MAKVTFGPAVSEARGKIGDTMFQRSRGGNTARALRLTVPVVTSLDGARCYNSTDMTVQPGIDTPLTLDSERFDNGGLHNPALYSARLTCFKAGVYVISAHIRWASGSATYRSLTIYLNVDTSIAHDRKILPTPAVCAQSAATLYHLNVGDYIRMFAMQGTAAPLDITATPNRSPELAMQQITQD